MPIFIFPGEPNRTFDLGVIKNHNFKLSRNPPTLKRGVEFFNYLQYLKIGVSIRLPCTSAIYLLHLRMTTAADLQRKTNNKENMYLNLYARYQNNPKIRWKNSIEKVLKKYEIEIENDNLRTQVLSDCNSIAGVDSFIIADDFKSI